MKVEEIRGLEARCSALGVERWVSLALMADPPLLSGLTFKSVSGSRNRKSRKRMPAEPMPFSARFSTPWTVPS